MHGVVVFEDWLAEVKPWMHLSNTILQDAIGNIKDNKSWKENIVQRHYYTMSEWNFSWIVYLIMLNVLEWNSI